MSSPASDRLGSAEDRLDPGTARQRMLAENARRRREVPAALYAATNPAEQFFRRTRRRRAARLLEAAGAFPDATSRCLEVGCGGGVWMEDLISWGVAPKRVIGAEIDLARIVQTRRSLPACPLLITDGGALAIDSGTFDLVVVSTVLSSVLEPSLQIAIAKEMARTIRAGGALLWYDFRYDNPRNPHVRGVSRRRLGELFGALPGLTRCQVGSVTLAPPIARRLARWRALVELLEGLPFLRTHLIAVYRSL